MLVFPADQHDTVVVGDDRGGQCRLLAFGEGRVDRHVQPSAQALNRLLGAMCLRLVRLAVVGGEQRHRCAQAGLQRSHRGREEHGQCAGTLPSTRQQRVDVLVAVDVNPEGRTRCNCWGRRIGRLFAVANDVDLGRGPGADRRAREE